MTSLWLMSGFVGLQGAAVLAVGHPLVHLNAGLNVLATTLLTAALWQIKRGREQVHGRLMLAALATSAAFLISYLVYHSMAGSVRFTHEGPVRYFYYAVLISHVALAFATPFLAVAAAALGATALGWIGRGRVPADASDGAASPRSGASEEAVKATARARHVRLVRWAYPIWLYVSVSGVAVYAMLYHIWPSADL